MDQGPQLAGGRDSDEALAAHDSLAPGGSTSPSAAHVEQLVRSSQEYAAAFDMEVWKAQQRSEFEQALAAEKRDRMKALEMEYAAKDVARLAEVDTLRRELEMMARRLDSSGRALAKRIQQQERREEIFEERRLQLARETESVVREMEGRHRRALEERDLKVESLSAQLRERELIWQQTQQRLMTTQQEYDALQRVVSRIQSRESAEASALAEFRRRCETLTEQLRETQVQLQERDLVANRATEEKATLATAYQEVQKQLAHTAKAYQALHDAVHREREHFFAQERERLVQLTRRAEAQQQEQPGRALAADVLYGYSAAAFRSSANGAAPSVGSPNVLRGPNAPPPSTEVQALQQMVAALQREAEAAEKERRRQAAARKEKRRQRHAAAAAAAQRVFPFAEPIVERPRPGSDAISTAERRGRSNSSGGGEPSPFRVTGHVGDVLFGSNGKSNTGDIQSLVLGTNDERRQQPRIADSVQPDSVPAVHEMQDAYRASSSLSAGGQQLQRTQGNEPSRTAQRDEDDANVSLSALSTPRSRRSEERNDGDGDEEGHDALRGHHRGTPALISFSAPSASHDATAGGAVHTALTSLNTSADSAVYSYVALPASLEDEIISSSRAAAGGSFSSSYGGVRSGSGGAGAASLERRTTDTATLGELMDFVSRLRENRDRLLSTGCYSAKDPLIEDMDAKIRVYERYLRVHEVVV